MAIALTMMGVGRIKKEKMDHGGVLDGGDGIGYSGPRGYSGHAG